MYMYVTLVVYECLLLDLICFIIDFKFRNTFKSMFKYFQSFLLNQNHERKAYTLYCFYQHWNWFVSFDHMTQSAPWGFLFDQAVVQIQTIHSFSWSKIVQGKPFVITISFIVEWKTWSSSMQDWKIAIPWIVYRTFSNGKIMTVSAFQVHRVIK